MAPERYSVKQIFARVGATELLISRGGNAAQATKKIAVTEQT